MDLPPQKQREIKLMLLWAQNMGAEERDDLVDIVSQQLKTSKKKVYTLLDSIKEFPENEGQIDAKIEEFSEYPVFSMHSIEHVILKLAIFELLFDKKTPGKVVISEGVRLAKKFGLDSAPKLVNGILDAIYKSLSDDAEKESAQCVLQS